MGKGRRQTYKHRARDSTPDNQMSVLGGATGGGVARRERERETSLIESKGGEDMQVSGEAKGQIK